MPQISAKGVLDEARLDSVEKGIYSELCKKFDYTTKWYVYKPESVQENETHKINETFEMQTYH